MLSNAISDCLDTVSRLFNESELRITLLSVISRLRRREKRIRIETDEVTR